MLLKQSCKLRSADKRSRWARGKEEEMRDSKCTKATRMFSWLRKKPSETQGNVIIFGNILGSVFFGIV